MIIDFITQEFVNRRKKNSAYSLRAYAQSLRMSPGALSAIVAGKRKLTFKMAAKILETLGTDRTTRQELLETTFMKTAEIPSAYVQIQDDMSDIIANWQYYGILFALESAPASDATAIAKRLKLNVLEVRRHLVTLEKMGLIRNERSQYKVIHKNLTTTHDVPSAAIRNAHKQWIEKALQALETQDVSVRDFSGMTMAIAPKNLPKAKKMILKFRRELSELLESGKQEEVYRLNVQLYSLEK